MRIVEDAFTYRLVWALEAIRTRRMSLGWSPEIIAGGAAATLETGVPQFMMAMLIRAGLPSRRAAMIAVRDGSAFFVTPAEMRPPGHDLAIDTRLSAHCAVQEIRPRPETELVCCTPCGRNIRSGDQPDRPGQG
jgi:hypothetical protein